MPRLTKTIKKAKVVSGENYCRMCQKMLSLDKFYEATNPFLDKNGFESIYLAENTQDTSSQYYYGNEKS